MMTSQVSTRTPSYKITSTVFTIKKIETLFAKNKATGECLNGLYFWASEMMSEDDYIDLLDQKWPTESDSDASQALTIMEQALVEHPKSSSLWLIRGRLFETQVLLPLNKKPLKGKERNLDEAHLSYEKTIELAPFYAGGYEALGYLYNCFTEELEKAEECFRKSLDLEQNCTESLYGLARVLAEQGKKEEALSILRPVLEDSDNDELVKELWQEISDDYWMPTERL